MRRPDPSIPVVVTGAGIVCSIGGTREEVWSSILAGRAGIGPLTRFPGETFPTSLAAEVPADPADERSERRLSRTDRFAVRAAREALGQANDGAASALPLDRTIVSTGSSTGGLLEGEGFFVHRVKHGRRRARVSRVLQQPTSAPADAVARVLGCGGGVVSNATACASAGAAIAMAADWLRSGHAGAAIAGGSDALCRLTYSGFNVLQAVDPGPCTPFGASRAGITLGEGAGYLVLERREDARARGATILAELAGCGATCDAHHPTAPAEDGRGAEAAMRAAVAEAGVTAADVGYVNAHGTGTRLNDASESKAIAAALGTSVPVSSTKSFFGHTLGAAGGVEAVVTVLALMHQVAPPTLRLGETGDDCPLDYIPGGPRPLAIEYAMSNTFGFGGSNVSLLFRRQP